MGPKPCDTRVCEVHAKSESELPAVDSFPFNPGTDCKGHHETDNSSQSDLYGPGAKTSLKRRLTQLMIECDRWMPKWNSWNLSG